jgi:uncharacterized protein YqgC (DUF456 family)
VDLSNTETNITVLCALAIIIGVFGVLLPLLPGLILCWAAALVWGFAVADGWVRWVVVLVATLVAVLGTVVKYAWPGRNLKRSGVPNRTLLLGGVLGIVGFFVIPVVGVVIGFVLGVYLGERIRLGDTAQAWPSTKHALKAAGVAILVELAAALMIAFVFVVGLTVSA